MPKAATVYTAEEAWGNKNNQPCHLFTPREPFSTHQPRHLTELGTAVSSPKRLDLRNMRMEKQLQTEIRSVITQTLTCAKQVSERRRDTLRSGAAETRTDERHWNPLYTLSWQAESLFNSLRYWGRYFLSCCQCFSSVLRFFIIKKKIGNQVRKSKS